MGFFNWINKGVDVEGEGQQENSPAPQDEFQIRKQQALQRLMATGNSNNSQTQKPVFKQPVPEGKKTVQIYMIKTNDDIGQIVEKLQNGEPVIANLNKVSKSERERTQDFLSGVVFALKAHISSFAPNIFLITPQGVQITN